MVCFNTTVDNRLFVELLPAITRRALMAFRRVAPDRRDDMMADTIAQAFVLYSSLAQRGRWDLVYSGPLADLAVKRVLSGRTITNRDRAPSYGGDIYDRATRAEAAPAAPVPSYTDPDAGFSVDFLAWAKQLDASQWQIVRDLAAGYTPEQTARRAGLSLPELNARRRELKADWQRFSGE